MSLGNQYHESARTIAITGDSTVDWMLIMPAATSLSPLHSSYQWELVDTVRLAANPGGASLLLACVSAAARKLDGELMVEGPTLPVEALASPSNDRFPRTYAIWQPFTIQHEKSELVWRMAQLLGVDRPSGKSGLVESEPESQDPDCLLVEDANLGFRDKPESWPTRLTERDSDVREIIVKMSSPFGAGPLWQELMDRHADNVTVYCTVDDLRKEYAPVGQPLSWERTAMEIDRAVRQHPELKRAKRVIVSVGYSGAVVVDREAQSALIYDPASQEGDWERRRPGAAVGLGTCVSTALAIEAGARLGKVDWLAAIRRGLQAARSLHDGRRWEPGQSADPIFPAELVASLIVDPKSEAAFQTVTIQNADDWQISESVGSLDYRSLAESIVITGDLSACPQIPMERFGAWASIDRMEIESMRAARGIAREYLASPSPSRPLNLAVFGPPGSGKSFAIKQMTSERGVFGHRFQVFEFNLSQLSSPGDLPSAFRLLRDASVRQFLPLVFWDEFDSALNGRELGWLSTFLAPMQDGTFVDGNVTRPIGPAIFIFAGGTHATMASFKERAVQLPEVKATDFLSRLRGYLDILGPNPNSQADRTFILRRALLLGALLRGKTSALVSNGTLNIDPGVLRAFLDVKSYVHGARSIESLIDMSSLSGRLRYERSALPPRNQLALHVDPDEFLGLVQRLPDSDS